MSDVRIAEKARSLRQDGMAPKAIARALGLSVADVVAALNDAVPTGGGDEPQCWVSAGWSFGLGLDGAPDWVGYDRPSADAERGGLVAVLVARHREHASKALVVGFLLDVWCLGIKDAHPGEAMSHTELAEFRQLYFNTFESYLQVPAALARDLVFGSVAYARGLGFEPHEDFEAAADVLGLSQDESPIRFGRDGQPFYMDGPYDDPGFVLRTLKRTVGDGNFGYVVEASEIPRSRLPSGGTSPGRAKRRGITPSVDPGS
ncbi:helix-turn-helix domain-containing protein [Catenulispora pinisilvae]|uniref:helix-turn-helix domain-containing protein n=1 Tax=Catenulispora pinisilvae TaxID=2705253 RepID=UPI001891187A|nr:helix-turn-helix domain-containing protein [Catenulispora pinisilvae]